MTLCRLVAGQVIGVANSWASLLKHVFIYKIVIKTTKGILYCSMLTHETLNLHSLDGRLMRSLPLTLVC